MISFVILQSPAFGGVKGNNITTTSQNGGQTSGISKTEPKPVECALCHRKFKNIPALNGHMRLHGGYFKKVCVFCLLTFFLLMSRRNEAFRTNLFPHIPNSRESVGDSAETTTRLKLSLNPLLSQNHQVHTRESGNHTSGRSRYFLFFTL